MAYRLKLGERVPQGIRRIVREEIEAAARQLSGKGETDRDEAIHEARKNVKKIRGVLRLVRPELREIYGLENSHFRGIGQQLSHFRDAGAVIETFDALRRKHHGEMDGQVLSIVRRRLKARKTQTEKHANIGEVLEGLAATLRQSMERVGTWPLSTDGFAGIAPGLEATFRRGQRALARARKHSSPESYHEWRKRVKDHWYHVRLLEAFWDGAMPAYERRLKDLETWLGEDHNLVVLQETVMADPGFYGDEADIGRLVRLIGEYHHELRDDALKLGERIYADKPRKFSGKMRHMWDNAQDKSSGPSKMG
ncbi:MAG: CHAD domain-containing protein [Bryobacteraceae bacterium]